MFPVVCCAILCRLNQKIYDDSNKQFISNSAVIVLVLLM